MVQPLTDEEWSLLVSAACGEGVVWLPWPLGRLLMRGLVVANGAGEVSVTVLGWAALRERADSLVGCLEGTGEEAELERLSDLLDRFENHVDVRGGESFDLTAVGVLMGSRECADD